MSSYNRNGRIFIQFQYKGETYKKWLPKGTSRKVAGEIENKWKLDLVLAERGLTPNTNEDQTFAYFAAHTFMPYVKDNHSPRSHDRAWLIVKEASKMFGKELLRNIKPADIERFKTIRANLPTMHGTKRKPATVLRELSILSKLFSMARRNGLCNSNPLQDVDKPVFSNIQDRVLTRDEETRLFEHIHGEWTRDVCLMALNTGLRQNDILTLQHRHVDFNSNLITLIQGKTQRQHIVALNDITREILLRRWENGSLYFLPSPKTGKPKGTVRGVLYRAAAKAGIARVTIRDLRRTAVTRVISEGFDTVTAARFAGHSDNRTIHRYVRSVELLQKAAESLAKSTKNLPEHRGISTANG